MIIPPVLLASFLPDTTEPYLILLGIGFLVGGYGQLAKLRWLTIFGILIILAAVISFQVAIQTLPKPPGF
jgi:hypothetical protein